ncbi:BTB/POZ domain-containing protein 6-A [Frankliniella fusca]|uniref:BTB/POZ domain-containing protein 6-A n=1 Tax=Frankliniella fusca TaxID=407009 RepID=A0AAE1I4S1_9NEOP|nr:BTB/POZ domain-containing protein 6-A [Frankliniella fusca]
MAATVKPQLHPPYTLLSRLGNLLQTSQWSDCMFLVGEGQCKQEFRAHRILLAACSPVFEAMCFGPLAEKSDILIPDLEPKAFQVLLQYVYTDSVQFSSVEEACNVLYAAKKYLISNLSQLCHSYVKRNMQAKDVVTVYEYAKLLGEDALYEPCLLMLKKYAVEVLNDATHHLSSSSVVELLGSDAINGCECCLIEGALSWAKRECEEQGVLATVTNQRLILEDCCAWRQLRFLTLSPQQFNRICEIEGLLTREEVAFIKEFLHLHKNFDEKRGSQCVNMCNSTSCPGSVSFDEISICEKNSNVVVVRDKWKRRRLNMVLSSPHKPENLDNWVDPQLKISQPVANPNLSIAIPASISDILRCRQEVGYRLSLCRRPLLKQSATILGPIELQVAMRVSAPIDLRAIQVNSRLIPASAVLQRCNYYCEKLEVRILDETGKLLTDSQFSDRVQYNTEIMVHLKKFVRLTQDRTYNIVVKLLDESAEYPLSFLGQFARSQEINFDFMDRTAKMGSGFVNRLDMGFIRGFAYS